MSAEVDPTGFIAPELWAQVFSHLEKSQDPRDVFNFRCTCKTFNQIAAGEIAYNGRMVAKLEATQFWKTPVSMYIADAMRERWLKISSEEYFDASKATSFATSLSLQEIGTTWYALRTHDFFAVEHNDDGEPCQSFNNIFNAVFERLLANKEAVKAISPQYVRQEIEDID